MNDHELSLKLVREIEKHEELYNYKLYAYSRKDLTEKAWQEVAAQVNISAAECKEKWRNLRTVFTRKLKSPPNGSIKKTYYLENAMNFCLPFIKTSISTSSSNFPSVPLNSPVGVGKNAELWGDSASQMDLSQAFVPTQESFSNFSLHSQFQNSNSTDNSTLSQQTIDPLEQFSSFNQIKKKWTLKKKSAADLDHSVAEYFKAKQARLQPTNEAEKSSKKIDRQQGIKMFLLSLIPELDELSDSQIKLFKRRVFNIIDEISTPQYQPQASTFHTTNTSLSDSSQTTDFYNVFSQDLHD